MLCNTLAQLSTSLEFRLLFAGIELQFKSGLFRYLSDIYKLLYELNLFISHFRCVVLI